MKVTYLMVLTYIADCVWVGTKPCKYFQLNSAYFDRQEGIFSKLAIDKLIPSEWRLLQYYDDDSRQPARYPVFVKPEWGQNARGIFRADNATELQQIRARIAGENVRYLVQEGALEKNEYEIFSMRHHRQPGRYSVLTITQAVNESEPNPINGIYNGNTRYIEITEFLSEAELETLWALVQRIGSFGISRASVRADSTSALLQGKFHVIEVNLFAPMPINMLDARYKWKDMIRFVSQYMMCLALLTKYRDKKLETKPVFTKIMLYNRKNRLLNFVRAHI